METIIAILFYLGVATSGSTTSSQTQFNQNQTDNTLSNQMRSGNSGQSGNGNIVITDNDKDN